MSKPISKSSTKRSERTSSRIASEASNLLHMSNMWLETLVDIDCNLVDIRSDLKELRKLLVSAKRVAASALTQAPDRVPVEKAIRAKKVPR
jgi:hypothetical protein